MSKHSCIKDKEISLLKNRISELENKNVKMEIIKAILTPKMFFSICLGISVLIQTIFGGY